MSNQSGSPGSRDSQGYLPRGGACVSCRRRKMKCDGQRPVCGQCERSGRTEDCEYVSGQERSRVQLLEDDIGRLESRIQELQNSPPGVPRQASVQLHQPYGGESASAPQVQDPPRNIAEQLVNGFLPYATSYGFFLHIPSFRASMFQAFAPGHPARPAPALIFSVYLWSIRLSKDPSAKANESGYLARAIQEASTALSGDHPNKTLHSIQAEVLLALYFFTCNRFTEGKYHVANAVATALSAGLHKIRSTQPTPSSAFPPARNPVEEGERILGAWTVFNLDKVWAVALESSPNFEHSDHALATKIDTPWPLEMEEFERGQLPPNVRTSLTVENFLKGAATPDLGMSPRAVESKASILWERANALSHEYSQANFPQNQSRDEVSNFDRIIDQLKSSIPPPTQVPTNPDIDKCRRLVVVYSTICAATIRLHSVCAPQNDASRRKRLSAAQVILEIVKSVKHRHLGHINPIIGTIWVEASHLYIDEISKMRSIQTSGQWVGASSTVDDTPMRATLEAAIDAMSELVSDSPLLASQVGHIRNTYEAI